MKKKLFGFALSAALVLGLAACGNDSSSTASSSTDASASGDTQVLKIAASSTPHAEILEEAAPLLEAEGVTLDITVTDDYNIPNRSLDAGDVDANYFQHLPYLNQQIEDYGYDIVSAGAVHIEPMGLYSQRITSLDDLEDGATVITSNSVSDWGRILQIFVDNDLLTLKDGVDIETATFDDIEDNPKNLTFTSDIDTTILAQAYENDEADLIAINANLAYAAGLNPVEDAIALESDSSPYANIVAVRSGDEDDERIVKLMEVLHSDEIQQWILDKWGGAVKPVDE
ncbi:MetQ/NlpA family ABC transporter substrate-binding protein [Enterococcus sp. LJL90]